MSHHLYAIVVRNEDIKPNDVQHFVKSEKEGFSIIAPAMALKHRIRMSMRRVQLMTDYFGGAGEQEAAYFNESGEINFFSDDTDGGAINSALALLGVEPEEGKDLFDVIGLGKYRDNEDLHPSYIPDEEHYEQKPQTMVGVPLEDYNEILRTLEDMGHWREVAKGMQRAGGDPNPKLNHEEICKELEFMAQSALKLIRKGVLL